MCCLQLAISILLVMLLRNTETKLSVLPFVKAEEFELCKIKAYREVRYCCFVVKNATAMLSAIPDYNP